MRDALFAATVLIGFALGVSAAYLASVPVELAIRTENVAMRRTDASPLTTLLRGTVDSVSTSSLIVSAPDPFTGSPSRFSIIDKNAYDDLRALRQGEQVRVRTIRQPGSRLFAYSIVPAVLP